MSGGAGKLKVGRGLFRLWVVLWVPGILFFSWAKYGALWEAATPEPAQQAVGWASFLSISADSLDHVSETDLAELRSLGWMKPKGWEARGREDSVKVVRDMEAAIKEARDWEESIRTRNWRALGGLFRWLALVGPLSFASPIALYFVGRWIVMGFMTSARD